MLAQEKTKVGVKKVSLESSGLRLLFLVVMFANDV